MQGAHIRPLLQGALCLLGLSPCALWHDRDIRLQRAVVLTDAFQIQVGQFHRRQVSRPYQMRQFGDGLVGQGCVRFRRQPRRPSRVALLDRQLRGVRECGESQDVLQRELVERF